MADAPAGDPDPQLETATLAHRSAFRDGSILGIVKNPHGVRDVLEDFVMEEGCEGRGALGITGGTDAPLATGEQEEPLGATGVTTKSCETAFWRRAVEVAGHYGVGEASPPSVGLLETVLPERLEVVVVRLDPLK